MTPTRHAAAPRVRQLADELGSVIVLTPPGAANDPQITDVTHDSRDVRPGALFAARPGQHSDGHDHAPAAVAAGAAALLVEHALDLPVVQLQVPSVAEAMGPAAAAVHGHPSGELLLCGVTGTNGKTTTAHLLDAVFTAAGHVSGLVGTVETRIAGTRVAGVRTTPESTDLQRLLRRMRDAGVTAAAMEVSSHGLALGRVRGSRFAAALFTNLTQDHLDFHADMEDYYLAKRSLFDSEYTRLAVVNVDDPAGRRLAADVEVEVIRVSVSAAPNADVTAARVSADAEGSVFTAQLRTASVEVRTTLPGLFNVSNCLLALTMAEALGLPVDAAVAGIAACKGVPGRMERVEVATPFTVIVDYAHTPDSLANVLAAVRAVADGRVIVVIGCGGDRDAGKRPLMGRAAVEAADLAVLTSDNPRSEDPQAILDAMVAGVRLADVHGDWLVEIDRRKAIGVALDHARPGDVVVVAGKGHETTQETATGTVPFDDRTVVRELVGGVGS